MGPRILPEKLMGCPMFRWGDPNNLRIFTERAVVVVVVVS
jgi:hypothetical protein